jgi:hypothetical protein
VVSVYHSRITKPSPFDCIYCPGIAYIYLSPFACACIDFWKQAVNWCDLFCSSHVNSSAEDDANDEDEGSDSSGGGHAAAVDDDD